MKDFREPGDYRGVLFCMPQYAGWCMGVNMRSTVAMVRDLAAGGFDFDIVFGEDSAVHRNRYLLTQAFMESPYKYLMFIDADIEYTTDDFGELYGIAERGAGDVVCGVYPLKKEGGELAVHTRGRLVNIADLKTEAPLEVDYAGTGFMLIRRDVFTALAGTLEQIESIKGKHPKWWGFDVVDGVELPEDYSFCERARAAGFKVVVAPNVRLGHAGLKIW